MVTNFCTAAIHLITAPLHKTTLGIHAFSFLDFCHHCCHCHTANMESQFVEQTKKVLHPASTGGWLQGSTVDHLTTIIVTNIFQKTLTNKYLTVTNIWRGYKNTHTKNNNAHTHIKRGGGNIGSFISVAVTLSWKVQQTVILGKMKDASQFTIPYRKTKQLQKNTKKEEKRLLQTGTILTIRPHPISRLLQVYCCGLLTSDQCHCQ